MRCIFIIFVMIATQVIHAQDRIRYIFPDSIEKELINYCYHRLESNPNICLYIMTENADDYYPIFLLDYHISDDSDLSQYACATNRYALIDTIEIPLLFDLDFMLATTTQKDLLGCGAAREGSYKRSILIIDAQPVAVYHRKKKSILINRNSSINCD